MERKTFPVAIFSCSQNTEIAFKLLSASKLCSVVSHFVLDYVWLLSFGIIHCQKRMSRNGAVCAPFVRWNKINIFDTRYCESFSFCAHSVFLIFRCNVRSEIRQQQRYSNNNCSRGRRSWCSTFFGGKAENFSTTFLTLQTTSISVTMLLFSDIILIEKLISIGNFSTGNPIERRWESNKVRSGF